VLQPAELITGAAETSYISCLRAAKLFAGLTGGRAAA